MIVIEVAIDASDPETISQVNDAVRAVQVMEVVNPAKPDTAKVTTAKESDIDSMYLSTAPTATLSHVSAGFPTLTINIIHI